MIKWIAALKFRSDRSKEACRQYWVERHGPLVLELAGLKHYVQSHRVEGEEDIGDAPYDGFASLWFEDEAAARRALASPKAAALKADADHFADAAGTRQALTREVVMRDVAEPAGALKLVTFNRRKPGLSPQTFQDYWENQHGALVLRNISAFRRYVQNHALISCYDAGAEPDFDGMFEGWLENLGALTAGEGTTEHEAVRADEANFIDPTRFRFMFVRETVFR
ncbi:MAG TPA: EthD family reductase [Caulobacteraceae bacterium]|nr:EthD family reductase [Caulobacteraceae bacterium]